MQQIRVEHLLRELRLEAGTTQSDLARQLEKPQSFVSKFETLERRLTFEEVETICATLGLTMVAFLERLARARQGKA